MLTLCYAAPHLIFGLGSQSKIRKPSGLRNSHLQLQLGIKLAQTLGILPADPEVPEQGLVGSRRGKTVGNRGGRRLRGRGLAQLTLN